MSSIDQNISAGGFIEAVNDAIDGLNISQSASASSVISSLNTAFANVAGRRILVDKAAPDFIGDVNYNIDLMGSGGDEPATDKFALPAHPKLLFIGNSYTLDSISYLPYILKAHGIEATIATIFDRNKGVSWYDDNYTTYHTGNDAVFLSVCDTTWENLVWQVYGTEHDNATNRDYDFMPTAQDAIKAVNANLGINGEWDMVSFMLHYTSAVDSLSSLKNDLPSLIGKVLSDLGNEDVNSVKIGISIPHENLVASTPKATMDRASALADYMGNNLDIVFPYGTAIFNARADKRLRTMKTASNSRNLLGDSLHLNEGLPCYIAALSVAETLFHMVTNYEGIHITGDEILPAVSGVYPSNSDWSSWASNIGNFDPQGTNTIYGIDGQNGTVSEEGFIGELSRACAVYCANNAVTNPYQLVSTRYGGGSTQVKITVNAENCTLRYGGATPNQGTVFTGDLYLQFGVEMRIWIIPNTGNEISNASYYVDWNPSEVTNASTYQNSTTKYFYFPATREDIVINVTTA